jgi:hypothetical protein
MKIPHPGKLDMVKPGCTRESVLLIPRVSAFTISDGERMDFSYGTELAIAVSITHTHYWATTLTIDALLDAFDT